VGVFKHYLTLGQSLPDGSQGTPALSTASEVANAYIVATDGTIANPLKSSTTQRPYLSMGYRIAAASPADTFGFSTHALSGQSIAQLSKGGSSGRYEQAIATVTAVHTARVAAGDTYTVPWINWFQGEADQTFGTTRAAYRAALLQLMADYAADIMAITGQAAPPKWMINQTATWAHYENAPSIGLEQLDIARTVPNVWAVGGQYQLPYADGLHMNNVGYYYIGELIGRAINAVDAGQSWEPFAPSVITATADGLTVTFDVPTEPLVLDTALVPEQPFYGFSLTGTAASITGVSLSGSATVTIATDKPVTESTARLGYGVDANNGDVGLGNLRDSNASVSVYDGHALPDFALHASDSFTPYPAEDSDRPQVIFRVTEWSYVGPTGLVPLTFAPAK
jgi:hypothetical protein